MQTGKHLLLGLGLSAAVAVMTGCATQQSTMGAGPGATTTAAPAAAAVAATRVAESDLAFASLAAAIGHYEVAASQLAATRAGDARVKSYAQMLVNHHTLSNNELMALMRSKNVALSTGLMTEHQAKVTQLSGLSGAAFDRAYIQMTGVQDHTVAIRQFEQHGRAVVDSDLKAWTEKNLPILRVHLQGAQEVAGTIAG